MLVRDAMTRVAEAVGPDELLQTAAARMRELDIGALVVVEGDAAVGLITDRDIVVRATAEGLDPNWTTVRQAMTPQAVTCRDGEPLTAAARIMERHAVRRLAVLDEQGELAGLLSLDDLAVADRPLAAEVLEHLRAPERAVTGWGPAPGGRPG